MYRLVFLIIFVLNCTAIFADIQFTVLTDALKIEEDNSIYISVSSHEDVYGFQCSVALPAGLGISDIDFCTENNNHKIVWRKKGDYYTIMVYSLNNTPLQLSDEGLIRLQVSGLVESLFNWESFPILLFSNVFVTSSHNEFIADDVYKNIRIVLSTEDEEDSHTDFTYTITGINSVTLNQYDNTKNISDLVIPSSIIVNGHRYHVTEIAPKAFMNMSQLKTVVIPETVRKIGVSAFENCRNINAINLNEGLGTIENGAFHNTHISEIHLPSTVDTIAYWGYLTNLQKITVDEANSSFCAIDNVLFSKDMSILYTYPYQLKDISYVIPEGVRDIKEGGFYNPYIKKLTLPSSIKSLSNTFFFAFTLQELTIFATTPPSLYPNTRSLSVSTNVLYVPKTAYYTYKSTRPWSGFNIEKAVLPGQHRVTYVVDNEVYGTDVFDIGEEIQLPEEPFKDCYRFSGWQNVPAEMPDEDIEITGEFILESSRMSDQELTLQGGAKADVKLYLGNTNTPVPDVEWESSNTDVVYSNANGELRTKNHGVAVLSAVVKGVTCGECQVTVTSDGGYKPYNYYMLSNKKSPQSGSGSFKISEFEILDIDNNEVENVTCYAAGTSIGLIDSSCDYLTDKNVNTKFTGGNPFNLFFKVDNPVAIASYRIYSANELWGTTKSWELYGSNTYSVNPTETCWELIDKVENDNATHIEFCPTDYTIDPTITEPTIYYRVEGQLFETRKVPSGDDVVAVASPSALDGYKFSGWYGQPEIMPNNNVNVNGYFVCTDACLSEDELILFSNEMKQLYVFDGDSHNLVQYVRWSSSDENVAWVSADGKVYAREQGTAVIKACSGNGVVYGQCEVFVNQDNNEIETHSYKEFRLILTSKQAQVFHLGDFSLVGSNGNNIEGLRYTYGNSTSGRYLCDYSKYTILDYQGTSCQLNFELPDASTVEGYRLYTAFDAHANPQTIPSSWQLYGRVIGSDKWELLDIVTDDHTITPKGGAEFYFPINSVKKYYYTAHKMDRWNWLSHNLNTYMLVECLPSNITTILSQTDANVTDPVLGIVGGIKKIEPLQCYKVYSNGSLDFSVSGNMYDQANYGGIQLTKGWNWIGLPLEGQVNLTTVRGAGNGDVIVSQSAFSEFVDGVWKGFLSVIDPLSGYLYYSQADKEIRINNGESGNNETAPPTQDEDEFVEDGIDIHKYPNTMNIVAVVPDVQNIEDYEIKAFSGSECRGVGHIIDGRAFLTVHGYGGEEIALILISKVDLLESEIKETFKFEEGILGKYTTPIVLNIIQTTGVERNFIDEKECGYTVNGLHVNQMARPGIYIINRFDSSGNIYRFKQYKK